MYFVGLDNRITIDDKVFSTSPQKKYQEVRKLLKPNPPEHTLLEHISSRLGAKTKGKHWEYDWKGPNAQCWCGNKLYMFTESGITLHIPSEK
ncbi:1676_t:CDS:2, partial [Dentiscutata erythropus]